LASIVILRVNVELFYKLPVALSGGKIEKRRPVAGENEVTVPLKS
jgi:hypothetical protein